MQSSTVAGSWTVALLSLSLAAGCAGYVEYVADNRQSVAAELTPPFHHQPHEPHHPSLFSVLIDWLADHGGLGQLLANVLIAVLVLPPLGPYVCGLMHNCDTARAQGRRLVLRAMGAAVDSTDDTVDARSSQHLEITNVLELLDAAYDKYA